MVRSGLVLKQTAILAALTLASIAPVLSAPPQDPIRIKDVPTLIEYVKGKNQYNRKQALLKLQVMGAEAKSAVPTLAETLSDPDEDIRALAFEALRSMESDASAATPILIKVIEGTNTDDRRHAIEVLGKMGAAAKPALPALRKASTDPDFLVSDDALEVLEILGEPQANHMDHDSCDTKSESASGPVASSPKLKTATLPVPEEHKDLNSNLRDKMEKTKVGWNAMRNGDHATAVKHFDTHIEGSPLAAETAVAYAGRGMTHVISREFLKGEQDFNRAVTLMPLKHFSALKSPNLEALVNIVYNGLLICHLNQNELADAINDQRAINRYNPNRQVETGIFCGTIYGVLGRFTEGIKEFDGVLKRDPSNTTALKTKELFKESMLSEALAIETKKVLRGILDERVAKSTANLTSEKLNMYASETESERLPP